MKNISNNNNSPRNKPSFIPNKKRKRETDSDIAQKVDRVDRAIKSIRNKEELKWNDTFPGNPLAFDSTGVIGSLTLIAQGDTALERQGSQISATSIQYKATFQQDIDQPNPCTIRHMIVWDSQANGAFPTLNQILDNSVVTPYVFAPYNREFQKRFKIVEDEIFCINQNYQINTTNWGPTKLFMKKKIQLHRDIKYTGAAGNLANIVTNNLLYVLISDITGAEPPFVYVGYRLTYKDD